MAKQIAVDVGDGAAKTNSVTLVEGDKYFFGNVSTASDDFDGIMSTNSTYEDMVELFYQALGGNVEGVKVTGLDCDGYTLEITNDAGVTDTLRVNADMSLLDQNSGFSGNVGDNRESFNVVSATDNTKNSKIIGTSKNYVDDELGAVGGIGDLVGGSAKGESDYQALLQAAMDGDPRVTLLDIDGSSFTIQINRNDVTDTFLVKDAGGIIANVFGPDSLINPKNTDDQFVFVSADDAPGKKIGIGTDAVAAPDEPGPLGGSLKVQDLAGVVAQADQIEKCHRYGNRRANSD
ncbi:hypothetical protein [Ruegeria arenilitoris]|uniref:hypothetical protein n=1 Tax=Ruegeria arenilitoris TaxID=1173585 RepID=UPI001480CA79|nr:hypothetical protein [Ruegeria arenilitoris]